jgi:hypothetical protein
MQKHMVGNTFVVVIDEIGEVTFQRDVLFKHTTVVDRKETAARCMAAVVELLDVAQEFVGISAGSFEVLKARELLLRDFEKLVNRLAEQAEFNDSAQQG